ncbi:hypothetical protein, partial [uncultured Campylobacter sp.]|uniref:hypothetical protein n=1 Tax=uncultured Campylobacter sp. TaxID=218934 RepID=UPI00262629A3
MHKFKSARRRTKNNCRAQIPRTDARSRRIYAQNASPLFASNLCSGYLREISQQPRACKFHAEQTCMYEALTYRN